MKKRLIWNDLKANKLLSFSTWAFMTLCAVLIALTCFLFSDLLGAINVLMDNARTPDLVQMHAGDIDEPALNGFVQAHDEIADAQVLRFLNLENASMTLGGRSLADNMQDNGVSVQSPLFDWLLDIDNQVIQAREGETWVPVCYQREYGISVGDTAEMGGQTLTIAGFLRDSQMNSMMSSSKRFLVSQADYDRMLPVGSEEYLIEMLLCEGADMNALSAAYIEAGLPANGPAITRPLIRLMNALSDGMTALVILLVSVVMLLISMLCIRFTLLSRLEADRREIGMLKAVGISRRDIRSLYLGKYVLLSALGAVIGLFLALLIKQPMQEGLQALYGRPGSGVGSMIAAVAGVALAQGVLLLSVARTLRRTERMTAVEALSGRERNVKKKRVDGQSALIVFVIAACVFLMAVPQNLHSTLSSPAFVTYMGIGGGDVRLDVRQTENIEEKTAQTAKLLAEDSRVSGYVSLITKSWPVTLPTGTHTRVNVELGDHTAFPVRYAEGRAPEQTGEIALSALCADDFGVGVGDALTVDVKGEPAAYTVCGIYSDLTNGGKTAKAAWVDDDSPVMWSVLYVSLNGADCTQWVTDCENRLTAMGINAKVVEMAAYVAGTYGPTLKQIELASHAARAAAVAVMLVVVALFTNLLVAKDRTEIALRKALGFTTGEVKRQYLLKMIGLTVLGVALGIWLGCVPGEGIAGMLLSSLGATGFRFLLNGWAVFGLLPVIALTSVLVAVLLGLRELGNVRAYECCVGRE